MKITIEDDEGNITELGLEDVPGDHVPLLRKAVHDIKNGRVPRVNRIISSVVHTPKKKEK